MNFLHRKIQLKYFRFFCQEIKINKEIIERHSKISNRKVKDSLTPQEKEKIASISLVTKEETEKINKTILFNQIHGITGLFISLLLLSTGCAIYLS